MPPFTVFHVCVGNICRSPMAERLLVLELRRRLGARADEHVLSHGAGTGSWHVGEPMNAPAARQVRLRGGDPDGFRARRMTTAMIEASDLILCATSAQVAAVLDLRPDARPRTFVLGEFGRLLGGVDHETLPVPGASARSTYDRGVALVVAADAARGGGAVWGSDGRDRRPSRPGDDLDDPWGMRDSEFARVADEIERTVVPLADLLVGHSRERDADGTPTGMEYGGTL
jgi:protein-tyrosine phosphatase